MRDYGDTDLVAYAAKKEMVQKPLPILMSIPAQRDIETSEMEDATDFCANVVPCNLVDQVQKLNSHWDVCTKKKAFSPNASTKWQML